MEVYVYDILVKSKTGEAHHEALRRVLEEALKYKLKMEEMRFRSICRNAPRLYCQQTGDRSGSVQGACYTRDAFAKEDQGTARSHWQTSIHSLVHLLAFRSMRTFLKALKRRSRINMGRRLPESFRLHQTLLEKCEHTLDSCPRKATSTTPPRRMRLEPSLHNTMMMVIRKKPFIT